MLSGLSSPARRRGGAHDEDVHSRRLTHEEPASKRIVVDTSVSSQFLSGLIMALPLLGDGYSVYVKLGGVSKTFVQMTLDCMRLGAL